MPGFLSQWVKKEKGEGKNLLNEGSPIICGGKGRKSTELSAPERGWIENKKKKRKILTALETPLFPEGGGKKNNAEHKSCVDTEKRTQAVRPGLDREIPEKRLPGSSLKSI